MTIQKVYAVAKDGTQLPITPETIGAVSKDQVATKTTLGLMKAGDNSVQQKVNDKNVYQVEVDSKGIGYVPTPDEFDLSEHIDSTLRNSIILNSNKKLVLNIDKIQHADTKTWGFSQWLYPYYDDKGTPQFATEKYQGAIKSAADYSAYTQDKANVIVGTDGIAYTKVLPATTTIIGALKISDAYTAYTTEGSYTAAPVLKNTNNVAYVEVLPAKNDALGSVKISDKYTAYTTLDSQTAAYLRITDAGYGYITVLPATTSVIGSFLASSTKNYEINSTIGNTVAWVNIHANNLAYVVIQPATASMLGSVIVSDKYTAYSTEDSQTAAYLRTNSAGKAYTPMLTETWTFTVLDDNDNETTVDKKVVLG